MENRLSIRPQHLIDTYLDVGYKCSVIFEIPHYELWYNSHFIQVYTYLSGEGNIKITYKGSSFQECYYSDVLETDYETFQLVGNDIFEYIHKNINNGWYVNITIDEFFISDKVVYNEKHFIHPTLVYGYNMIKKELYAIGFNKNSIFDFLVIGYDEFKAAYNSAELLHSKRNADLAIEKFRSKCLTDYKFNSMYFLAELKQYLYSMRFDCNVGPWYEEKYEDAFQYGLNVYKAIIESFRNNKFNFMDYRAFHLLAEHKRELLKKINYFKEIMHISTIDQLIDEYNQKVVILSEALRRYILKIGVSKRINSIEIISKTESLYRNEEQILNAIYNKISDNYD